MMETLAAVSKKDIVTGIYESFGKGDIQSITNGITEDVIWDASQNPILPEAKIYRGKQNVPLFFKLVVETMDITVFEPQNFFERGNVLFVNGRFEYTLKKNNTRWKTDWTMRWQFRGDKVERFNEYFETPQAL
jgi:ketosteroid isomerase-like protein